MSPIDPAIFAFLAIFIYSGFRAGIVQKLFSIIGMIVALVLAVKFMGVVGDFLVFITGIKGGGIKGPATHVVSFLMIFVVGIATTKLTYFILMRGRKGLPTWHHVLGSLAGLVEGGVILSVLLIWLNAANLPNEYLKERSLLYQPVLHFAPRLFDGVALGLPGSKNFYHEMSKHLEIEGFFKR